MIFDVRVRAIQTLLFTPPMTDNDRALRVGIKLLEDAESLEHRDRAGAVVGRARSAVPRIVVRREHDVLVRFLRSFHLGDDVRNGQLTGELGAGVEPDARRLTLLRQPEEQVVIFARYVDRRHLLLRRAEHLVDPRILRPVRADDAGHAELLWPRILIPASPGGIDSRLPRLGPFRAERAVPLPRPRLAELLPLCRHAARRIRRAHEHELSAETGGGAAEVLGGASIGKQYHVALDVPPLRAGTPREHHRLERAHTRSDEIQMRRPPPP